MGVERTRRRGGIAVLAAVSSIVVAGCGGQAGSVASGDPDPVSTRLGNLLAFNSSQAPAMPGQTRAQRVDCPVVQIEPGHSSIRVGGPDASTVRYQIAIGDAARECSVVDGQLVIRVGVETRTVIGPAGAPGTYTAPLRVTLRKTGDEAVVASKTYRVGGAVGSTGSSINSLIADPVAAPFVHEHTADDYEILLSMGQGEAEPRARRRR
jgi:hypothetical protein